MIAPVERVPDPEILPTLREVANRFVDDAVVANKAVEVAAVVVDLVIESKICAPVKVLAE